MDYIIKRTDPAAQPIVVKQYAANGATNPIDPAKPPYPTATSVDTSLVLLGKGSFDYGQPIQTNLVQMLENYSYSQPPATPIKGQLWYDSGAEILKCYDGTDWFVVAKSTTGGGGTLPATGVLDMNGYRIINLADAQGPDDALNLGLADTRYAKVAGDVFVGPVEFSQGAQITEGTFSSTQILDLTAAGAGITGAVGSVFAFGGARLTGAGDPVNNQDLATKAYVDAAAGTGVGQFLPLLGGTMAGNIMMGSAASIILQNQSNMMVTSGATFTLAGGSVFAAGGVTLQNIGNPVNGDDAAPKSYIDDAIVALQQYTNDTFLPLAGGDITGFVTFEASSSLFAFGEVDLSGASFLTIDLGTY